MADPGFVGYESFIIGGRGVLFKKNNAKLRIQKLGTKVNIYLESKQKSQQITNLKKASKCYKHHKTQNNNNIIALLINCPTNLYSTYFPPFFLTP